MAKGKLQEKTQKSNERIYKLYEEGKSLEEIGKILHLERSTVYRRFQNDKKLKTIMEKRKSAKSKMIESRKEEIIRMMMEGMTFEDMSQILKCKRSTLYHWLSKNKIL